MPMAARRRRPIRSPGTNGGPAELYQKRFSVSFFGNLLASGRIQPTAYVTDRASTMRHAQNPQIAADRHRRRRAGRPRPCARRGSRPRHHAGEQPQALPARPRHPAQRGEAEDVVQETYVRAFTHLEQFRGDSSLATWLARIAMNEALGRLRRLRPSVEWTRWRRERWRPRSSSFRSPPLPKIRKNPWHNVKSSKSSSRRSTNCPRPSASSSSPA